MYLKKLYREIEITSVVKNEVGIDLPAWITINDQYNKALYMSLIHRLDEGEASSIALAAETNGCLLIIDEKKGRRQALEMGIKITGLAGIIIRAKKEGIVNSGKELLDGLMAKGFRLSDKIYCIALEQMEE